MKRINPSISVISYFGTSNNKGYTLFIKYREKLKVN